MKIEVRNFGKIKKGQVDLDKKVTVFVGYNNSGKTYMSQLIWSLNTDSTLSRMVFNGLREFSNELKPNDSITLSKEYINKFITTYASFVKNYILPDLFNVNAEYFSNDKFAIDFVNDLLEKINKTSFTLPNINSDNNTEYYLFTKPSDSLVISIEKKQFEKPIIFEEIIKDKSFQSKLFYEDSTPYSEIFNKSIYEMVIVIFFSGKRISPFFLPANRVFYPSFYKYIYSTAKEEIDLIDDRLKRNENIKSIKALSKRPYTKAMDDLIQKFYGLNSNLKINTPYDDLLNELKELIGGDIVIKSSEGIAPIEFYLKLNNGKELEMYMSSSSANQLTPLYLYLKYWAEEKNNFLIIDEPEENLHPENQIKLVNLLMNFADRGNKVLITTHSPLITDHVNNYANLSYLNEAGTDTEHLIAEGCLNMASVKNIKHADYGVYFFDGDSIKEYAVDDYGAYFKDFQTAEDKVKEMSNILKENIYNNIHSDAQKPL